MSDPYVDLGDGYNNLWENYDSLPSNRHYYNYCDSGPVDHHNHNHCLIDMEHGGEVIHSSVVAVIRYRLESLHIGILKQLTKGLVMNSTPDQMCPQKF